MPNQFTNNQYTKEILIEALLRAFHELGRVPKIKDMGAKNGYPAASAYRRYFGSWNNALKAAGLSINVNTDFTAEYLIGEFHRYVQEFGKIPTSRDMNHAVGYPSVQAIRNCFGSFNNGLIAAGLKVNLSFDHSDDKCSRCNSTKTNRWFYDNNHNLICSYCYHNKLYTKNKEHYCELNKLWRKNNKDKLKITNAKIHNKRRGFGYNPINTSLSFTEAHHLWLTDAFDLVIHIPYFLHKLHWHSHNNSKTMMQINCIALDYWINEDFYTELYWSEI